MEGLRLEPIDRDARQVAGVMVLALLLGCIFVWLSIPMQVRNTLPTTAAARPAPTPQPAGTPSAASVAGAVSASSASAAGTSPSRAPGAAGGNAGAGSGTADSEAPQSASATWAGLLWAFACWAVGCFVGFIFGIPRTLSSDTARTAVRVTDNSREAAKAVAGTSNQTAGTTAAEKSKAAEAAARAGDPEKKDLNAVAAVSKPTTAPPATVQAGRGASTAVNTNLEQVSDWLTKIIVGVSLVNSQEVGKTMWQAAKTMALSIGGSADASSQSLALAILVYFGVIGLLGGYLLTRLYLQRAFNSMGSMEQSGNDA